MTPDELVARAHQQVIDWRRHLHQNPELSFPTQSCWTSGSCTSSHETHRRVRRRRSTPVWWSAASEE